MMEENVPEKPPIPVPESAGKVHEYILEELKKLLHLQVSDCLNTEFRSGFSRILDLFEEYQCLIIDEYGSAMSCARGCSWCCNHWVEDVNSFEAEIIADYIRKNHPAQISQIVKQCKNDLILLENLDDIVSQKVPENGLDDGNDSVFILLSSFYQLKRPCPLLDANGGCSIYPVRPLTCRVYMSFSSSKNCHPTNINQEDIPTYIMDLREEANELVDKLHFRFQKYEDDTGLRSLLVKYLGDL
ncbi:hypothetical protein CHISP_1076 [Chitinispirillum alkaliphilum]|nr:hypothetical protein CHISP_1076 [Chitinispirillum alkaliphilum]